ncbi:MAG: ATP-dependent zinc metalloprotease FtsH [Faecousia sp.]|nr:ATP-dependent zinc metalloprotease FtsH [Bacillota bacterium]
MANRNPNQKPQNDNKPKFSIIALILLVIVLTFFGNQIMRLFTSSRQEQVTYDRFLSAASGDRIQSAEIGTDQIAYTLREDVDNDRKMIYYTTRLPNVDLTGVVDTMQANGVEFTGVQAEDDTFSFLFSWVIFPILLFLIFSLIMRMVANRAGGGGGLGGIGNIGKSKAKMYMEKETGVTFRDVAGQDEAKESLVEIIDFLHNPKKYTAIGAKLPKGALLVGSPGTGKTLLAKAVAGEAHVPFFSISGSDFVEMFVGVGASRVRDLFQEASKVAPAIIFIDEIDAIGRSRDSKFGGNDEREQTLNQLLAEIDGFDSSKGVVILAATNRPEVLDKALLRAGRFDRRIVVDRPNLEGRYQTLLVHTRNIRLAEDVDLRKLAQATAGAVGADLANLVNEAALRAVRMGRQAVNQQDLLVSFETVIAGTEKKGTVLTDMEKRIVAYHEVGHALVAALRKHSQPVSKITIVPHTSGALGYTMQMPEEEKYLNSKEELLIQLQTLLGGRAAEQTVFGIQTTGAANDIQRATELARRMVTQFGMSDKVGLMALAATQSEYLDGQAYMDCAQTTAATADDEVRALLNTCYEDAKQLLRDNRSLLDEIALYLLQKETITGDELMAYVNADSHRLPASETEEAQ